MGFFESAKMFANQAVDSTRYAAQKTKLKSNIKSEENNIERQYTEIGRYYFNKYVNNPDPEVVQFYDNAKRSMDAIYRHNQEIARIESMEAAMNQGGNHQYGQQNMQPNMQQGFNQNNMGGMQPNPQGFNQNNMGGMQPNPQGFNQSNMGGMQPNPQGFNQNNMGGMQGFNQNNVGGMQPNPQGFNQNIQGGVTPAEPQNIAPAASQADNNSEQ
ncbi:hypothetical protein DXB54_02585 [Coprococcus sp. OM04-5BH]|jgi:hypothetical protein|uniref:hypothetical protein n=1 Tax=Coprococcus sp. OM04-5BH TaxID=2293093 RepID=UPI000E480469|nr:hypothetical protein [Coprococcus sp. OM04-5BH]RHV34302.1 hypothetical protein DXB54_02585 [Coprococcus sp. OM04-5BH]